ncbi:hypothetical protein G6L35_05930 [Agrobacterium tumefaciens]|uniref:hypothetical protein n=1 Tax=Agrobacterium tumefaciens TaxID=358 RepID=UPI001574B7A1|nr:hypothetical protein [Agrobacterium tumefaciens]NSZ68165.1 hypothetical protein [Agrobacterium tumefaciens]
MMKTDRGLVQDLLDTIGPNLTPRGYQFRMAKIGYSLADKFLAAGMPDANAFHVVTAVEDFEGLAAGVINRLRRHTPKITYSCLWPRHKVLSEQPPIEICAIDQAFTQKQPDGPFQILFVAANVGSVSALKAMMLHTVADRRYDGVGSYQILTPVAHKDAAHQLKSESPEKWRNRIDWTVLALDYEKSLGGFTVPGLRGNPSVLAGLPTPYDREQFIPLKIRDDFNFPLDPGPEPEPTPRANRENGGGTPKLGG